MKSLRERAIEAYHQDIDEAKKKRDAWFEENTREIRKEFPELVVRDGKLFLEENEMSLSLHFIGEGDLKKYVLTTKNGRYIHNLKDYGAFLIWQDEQRAKKSQGEI